MSISETKIRELREPRSQGVCIAQDAFAGELIDARTRRLLLVGFPWLWYGTPEEWTDFEILGDSASISLHGPELKEHWSVVGLLGGRRPAETREPRKRGRASRTTSWNQPADQP